MDYLHDYCKFEVLDALPDKNVFDSVCLSVDEVALCMSILLFK